MPDTKNKTPEAKAMVVDLSSVFPWLGQYPDDSEDQPHLLRQLINILLPLSLFAAFLLGLAMFV